MYEVTNIGASIPLSVFAFTKNKYARIASIIASIVGGISGYVSGFGLAMMYGITPKKI